MTYPTKLKRYAVNVRAMDTPEAELVFTIDYTRLDEEMAGHIIGFHMGDDNLLSECDDDLEQAIVFKTVRWAYAAMLENDWNEHGLSAEFDDMEGWPGDGMVKFTTATCDRPELEWEDLEVSSCEVKQ